MYERLGGPRCWSGRMRRSEIRCCYWGLNLEKSSPQRVVIPIMLTLSIILDVRVHLIHFCTFQRRQYLMRLQALTRWRSWLRLCATGRKVAGSIPDGVTGIFQRLKPSGPIVALRPTQPLTEMSTRNPSWG